MNILYKGQVAILHTSIFMEHTSHVSIHGLFFLVYTVQSLYNVIYLGSIGIDCVITELYYKGTILQRNNIGNYYQSIIK